MKTNKNLGLCCGLKVTKGTWQLNATLHPEPGMGLKKNYKGHYWDNWEIFNTHCVLDNNVVFIFFFFCNFLCQELHCTYSAWLTSRGSLSYGQMGSLAILRKSIKHLVYPTLSLNPFYSNLWVFHLSPLSDCEFLMNRDHLTFLLHLVSPWIDDIKYHIALKFPLFLSNSPFSPSPIPWNSFWIHPNTSVLLILWDHCNSSPSQA